MAGQEGQEVSFLPLVGETSQTEILEEACESNLRV